MSSEANRVEARNDDQGVDHNHVVHSLEVMKEAGLVWGTGGCPEESVVQVAEEITDLLRDKYVKFFQAMSVDLNAGDSLTFDEVDKIYMAVCKVRRSNHFSSPISEHFLRACCGYPAMIISYRSFEDKVKIAHGAALLIAIDNKMLKSGTMIDHDNFVEDLSLFHLKTFNPDGYEKFYPNRGPLDPLLEELIVYLRTDLNPFFTQPRHLNMMIAGTLDFFEVCQLEYDSKHDLEVTEEMVKFPEFLRLKGGASEMFMLFMLSGPELVTGQDHGFFYRHLYPMIAELVDSCNLINDYLSFYKEAQEGELSSYIFSYAKVNHISPMEALDEIFTKILDIKRRVMIMAERSSSLEVKKAVLQYFNGFIAWHVWWNKRYKLKEVLGDWYEGQYI